MEDISKTKQIKFLSNEPCREDAFEGHAHQDIAKQISYIIKTNKKIHIIGLDGSWGSGKSNLISLVNKELNGDKVYDESFDHTSQQYPFFIYDAWGHQVDYQRRAILEELTNDLTTNKKILKDDKWRFKLANLLAKKKKTSTKEVPKLSVGIITGVILCFLTPLIIFLAGLIPESYWGFRLLVATCPYVAGFLFAIIYRYYSLNSKGEKVSFSDIISELILIYKDKIKENETYVTISEKEPSSFEFKHWIEEMNEDLLKAKKTLIIVFDNMDRLPSSQVESLWSSIHTFFSDKTYDNIKVLIPFDRKQINLAFKKESSDTIPYGNDFINKTFDIVFRVPPPIMSDWQHYMDVLWRKAFGENEIPNIAVKQIYGTLKRNDTPREIIAFINEFATIKMTMQEEIPDKYIALFIFGKEKLEENPIKELLNPSYMGEVAFEYSDNTETIQYLSALYYHLPVRKALDVVFTKEAEEALNTGNSSRLISMMERINISTIIGNAILKVTDIERAIIALAGIDTQLNYGEFDEMPDWLKKIWEDLYCHCNNSNIKWNEVKEFHSILFKHLYSEELAQKIITGYFSIEDDQWEPEQFRKSIDNLRENNEIIDKLLKYNRKKASPKLFIKLLSSLGEKYNNYGIDYNVEEVDEFLASMEWEEGINLEIIPVSKIEGEYLPKYREKLREWLSDSNLKEISDLKNLFSRLKETDGDIKEFQKYFNDTRIYNAWNSVKNTQEPFKYDLLSMRISRNTNFQSTYTAQFTPILSSTKEEDIKGLAKVIEYYIDYGTLLINFASFKSFPIVIKVVEHLTIHPENTSRINCKEIIKGFNKIITDYGLDSTILFNRLNQWDYSDEINITDIPSLPIELFIEAQKNDNNLSKKILNTADEYFQTLSQERWIECMSENDSTYQLWKLYHPNKYQANYDALKYILKGYANGSQEKPDSEIIRVWMKICKEVGFPIKVLINDICNILKTNSNSNKEKLMFFEEYLFDFLEMDKQRDFINKLIPSEIIDKDIIKLISTHYLELKDCEVSDEFRGKIKNLANSNLKDDENFKRVCKVFKISIPKQKQSK